MSRAQVCLISSSKSGERHLYLIKVSRDKISDNDDQETANCDAKGKQLFKKAQEDEFVSSEK